MPTAAKFKGHRISGRVPKPSHIDGQARQLHTCGARHASAHKNVYDGSTSVEHRHAALVDAVSCIEGGDRALDTGRRSSGLSGDRQMQCTARKLWRAALLVRVDSWVGGAREWEVRGDGVYPPLSRSGGASAHPRRVECPSARVAVR